MQNPDEKKKPVLLVAIDIEKTGPRMSDPIIAIGVAVGKKGEIGTLYHKRLWCMPTPPDDQIEKKCFKEFWSKPENYPILQKIRECPQRTDSEEQGILFFYGFVRALEDLYSKYDIQFISDNPAYDIGHIDYIFETKFNIRPTRYDKNGDYRYIEDPSGTIFMLGIKKEIRELIKEQYKVVHDHMPDNDAYVMLLDYLIMDQITSQKRQQFREIALETLKSMKLEGT